MLAGLEPPLSLLFANVSLGSSEWPWLLQSGARGEEQQLPEKGKELLVPGNMFCAGLMSLSESHRHCSGSFFILRDKEVHNGSRIFR